MVARVLIHSGFFSIGVAALRASTRSMRRPSGAIVTGVSRSSWRVSADVAPSKRAGGAPFGCAPWYDAGLRSDYALALVVSRASLTLWT
ncbi:hypothetical protein Ccel01_37110 [Cellulosimicrobium cellulans]|uniref:Secreted protein n=1 Tax=Cellulosimicrobium cellulans TaxID=1710 RepID=A0AAV5P917_CELCE|nr:hypothetical protein Ccel01_37110 [Cellulosimicrobium cellulans]